MFENLLCQAPQQPAAGIEGSANLIPTVRSVTRRGSMPPADSATADARVDALLDHRSEPFDDERHHGSRLLGDARPWTTAFIDRPRRRAWQIRKECRDQCAMALAAAGARDGTAIQRR